MVQDNVLLLEGKFLKITIDLYRLILAIWVPFNDPAKSPSFLLAKNVVVSITTQSKSHNSPSCGICMYLLSISP